MAYEITATRKRPQTFDEMAGQEFVVATLKSSIGKERIAHAYLFAGPRGVGKTSAARILAKALNCQRGLTENPCGTCVSCTEIAQGNSLDVIEIDGASNTSVNDVREIKDEVLFSPNSSRYKIYIIDEVHMLSNSAFNALLKTIEEPPPYIVFIFATTEIHKVPATIRSRCQQFNFRLISVNDIRGRISDVVGEMGIEAEEEALLWIAREATGSLRDAYTILDQVASFSEGNITLAKIKEKMGIVGADELGEILLLWAAGDSKGVLEHTDSIIVRGVAVEQFVIDLTEYLRNVLFCVNGIKTEELFGFSSENLPENVKKAFTSYQIERAIELLLELYRKLRYSLNPRFELELLMSRLTRLKSLLTGEEILERINSLKAEIEKGSGYGEAKQEEAASSPPDNERQVDFQEDVISGFRRKKPTLASALEKAKSWSIEGETLRLTFGEKDRFSGEMVLKERDVLRGKVAEVAGRSLAVRVDFEARLEEASPGRDEKLESQLDAVKRVFKGEIVQGEDKS